MPDGCRRFEVFENPLDDALVGPLVRPSTIVKLSDRECPLLSLAPPAEPPTCGCGGGRPLANDDSSLGVALLPIGVARRSCGGAGREEGREGGCERGASSGTELVGATGFWLGEGGMARPRRGVRGPEPVRGTPGIGGRRRGTGEDMAEGRELKDGS